MAHLRLNIVVAVASLYSVVATIAAPAKETVLPPFSEVQGVVESHFAEAKDRGPRDLISRSEVERALDEVKKLGWDVQDREKILAQILPDQHVLVVTFRTPAGRKFMQQISGRELMYDRLDRISEVSGGSRLIRDIVKLPDGERYAKPKSGGGIPDLLDLLPKNASGQTRRIADYHKPTGHIYTVADLLAKLADSYRTAQSANGKNQ
jgi:hypothetical protein